MVLSAFFSNLLGRFEALFPRASRIVELRFFGGLTEKEAAQVLEISTATLKRDWDFARAWLFRQTSGEVLSHQ